MLGSSGYQSIWILERQRLVHFTSSKTTLNHLTCREMQSTFGLTSSHLEGGKVFMDEWVNLVLNFDCLSYL